MKSPRPRGRPKQDEVGAIESGLLDVALQEFIAHGYGGASISRIVRNAKVSKTTLYSRYESKGDLFRAILQQQIDGLAQGAALMPKAGKLDLAAGLKAFGRLSLEASFDGGLLQVNRLIYAESHRFPELAAAAAERSELGVRQIADFIARCAEADGIQCRDPRAPAEVFIFTQRGWYLDAVLTGKPVPKAALGRWVDRAVEVLLAGRAEW